jgi:hypothetical protein
VLVLDDKAKGRLIGILRDAIEDEIRRNRVFDLVEELGQDVVRIQGWLYDLAVDESSHADPRNFPLCFAELRMILMVRHSQTAQALARVVDGEKVSRPKVGRRQCQTVQWREVKASMKPWARFLRQWLEEVRELPSITK